jgi:hypothetical protein
VALPSIELKGSVGLESSRTPEPDTAKLARQAVDEAIATVTRQEYCRLKGSYPGNFVERLERAFKSVYRLQTPGCMPDYDQWDAPLYTSWYQARQIHLVTAMLRKLPPPRSESPLRIIDFGCGAWAAPIAIAVCALNGWAGLDGRQVRIDGIEPKSPMTRMGTELWTEFLIAAEDRGLNSDGVIKMIDEKRIYDSAGWYFEDSAASASSEEEYWLLAVHALYEKSKNQLGSFLGNARSQIGNRVRYEFISTHMSKAELLREVLEWQEFEGPELVVPTPIWECGLQKTTRCRRDINTEINAESDSGATLDITYQNYLRNEVSWNPGKNRIECDAVWVRTDAGARKNGNSSRLNSNGAS